MTLVEVCTDMLFDIYMQQILELLWCSHNLETDYVQVGPRFCLNPIKIFGGSFGGPTLYENPLYISPNQVRDVLLISFVVLEHKQH